MNVERMGLEEIEVMRGMFKNWLKSDFDWAIGVVLYQGNTGEEDEWDFLLDDWQEKFWDWMYPYVKRLKHVGYISQDQVGNFTSWAYAEMDLMIQVVRQLEVRVDG